MLKALTDASLPQSVAPGGRTLGRLAWHTALSVVEMGTSAGLPVEGPEKDAPQPDAAGIAAAYEQASASLAASVGAKWTDQMLDETIEMYGQQWTRGQALSALIGHQAHHRGQMTVLMRQAGLTVPGVYGPAKEEWGAYGVPAEE